MSNFPEFKSETSENYKIVNVGGIAGSINAGGLEAIIYSEQKVFDEALKSPIVNSNRVYIKRMMEINLRIDPVILVSIHNWLGEKIKEYEKIFSKIPSPEEIENKANKKDPLQ